MLSLQTHYLPMPALLFAIFAVLRFIWHGVGGFYGWRRETYEPSLSEEMRVSERQRCDMVVS